MIAETPTSPKPRMQFDRETFVALLIGHLIFVSLVGATNPLAGWMLTPAFVVPMLIARRRSGRLIREIVVFAVLMTGVHYVATLATVQIAMASPPQSIFPRPSKLWIAGGLGGLIGSSSTFVLMALFRLVPAKRSIVITMLCAIIALTAIAGIGLKAGFPQLDRETFEGRIVFALWLYSPWQILFAAILANVLLPTRAVNPETSVG